MSTIPHTPASCFPVCALQAGQDTKSRDSKLPDLPEAVLQHILRHLPQHERFRDAALVQKAWKEAANQATTELQLYVSPARAPGLEVWLHKHAEQLVSLRLVGP